MSDSEEDDAHFCLRCKGTFIGLDIYIEHRKVKCKREETPPLTSLELQCTKGSSRNVNLDEEKTGIPSGNETSNRGSWSLEGLQSSSPSVKEDARLEDVLQRDLLEINRKDEMLDTFLPSHDNDPCLKAVDFFSILELQSSKNPTFHELPASQKSAAGMLTRSKSSAVLQAKKNRDPFGSKSMTPDYQYDPYQSEHSQYVVGRDVVIAENYDYRKEVDGSMKENKSSETDSPKSKLRIDDRMLEDDGKSANEFLFQEVHNEVIISSEGKLHEDSDSYSEESEEEDEDDEYETRRISTGGKWKPGGSEWSTSSYWSSAPPESHTGGKWKPAPPPMMATSSEGIPSTSSAHHEDTLSEPQSPRTLEINAPPPGHTRGKWLPTIDSSSSSKVLYWCGPCNRRLSSLVLYEKHCQSDLHRKRTQQENQLEEDLSMEHPRARGKREVKRTQTYINSDLWSKSKKKRLRQVTTSNSKSRGALHCEVCECRVWPHLMGKHLVSHFHSRRARSDPRLAGELALHHIHAIVLQAPFQCGLCRFFCNTPRYFLHHWRGAEHAQRDSQAEGRYCCPCCRVESSSSSSMYEHLLSARHTESVAVINGSVPIVIQKKTVLQCDVCDRQFRYNVELRQHAKLAGPPHGGSTGTDKYQEREVCPRCSFVAYTKLSIQRHLAFAHKEAEGKFFCTCCDLSFETAADAKAHRTTAEHKFTWQTRQNSDKELTRVCCHCYSVFSGVVELKRHLKEEHPEMAYRCIRCGQNFTLKQELARHVRVGCGCLPESSDPSSSSAAASAFPCPKCAFTSTSEAESLFHLAFHTDPEGDPPRYRCPSCPRVFLKTSLKKHLLSHTGERPYTCRICEAGFSRKDVLENHILSVHSVRRTGDEWQQQPERRKTKTCEDCGASFYDKSGLQQHRKIHDGKQFQCPEPGCVYAGRSRGDLRLHSKSHSEERPFRCGQCDFTTKTKAQLVRHGRSHLDTRTHHCPHCRFTCNSSTHLNRHLRLHTGAKPFHCPHCSFSCNLLENLRKHVLSTKKHPGKSLYSCQEPSCAFASNLAKSFREHLVTAHGQSATAATSFVTSLYRGGEDPRHVDQPLPVNYRKSNKQKQRFPMKKVPDEDPILDTRSETLSDNPTLASAAISRGHLDPGRSEDLLQTVIITEPTDDVICIELPADDGDALDGYDGTSFFAHGDAFPDMTQRTLFEGLHRSRTVSLGESAVLLPLGSEDMEDHADLILIDEGMEHPHG